MYSKAAAAEIAVSQMFLDIKCQKYILPVRLVLPHVLNSKRGLRRLEIAYPHMCKLYPELAGGRLYNNQSKLPYFVMNFDWLGLPWQHFCDYVLALDLVVELPDGIVLGVDVTTQPAQSRQCLDKEEKLMGLRPLLKSVGVDTTVIISLEMEEVGYKALSPISKEKVMSSLVRKVDSINPRKWVRVWEMTIQE